MEKRHRFWLSGLVQLTFIVPIFCVHLTWVTGTLAGNLEPCVVYWSDCYSISATGRQYPEFFLFKALMLPAAVLMVAYWLLLTHWWSMYFPEKPSIRTICYLGLIACLALVTYTVTLGALGDTWQLFRRTGIVLFFVCTSFAHLLLLYRLSQTSVATASSHRLRRHFTQLKTLCSVLVTASIISGLLGYLWTGWDRWENAFEWWYALLMMGQFVIVGNFFSATQFAADYRIGVN